MVMKSTSERLGDAMERARRHWELRRKAEAAELAAPAVPPPFTIALSREAGAEGPAVARAVGDRLNWPVYDYELLQRIAGEMGLRAKLLESVDERRESWLRECLEQFTAVPTISSSAYVRQLVEMLVSLAAHGECVIVGRGAAQILPPETTLRVRLLRPLEERITAIRQRFGLSREEASAWIEKTDRERFRFVKDHFQKDPTDPRFYDLVLNTARFSPEECADFIVRALHVLQERGTARQLVMSPA